MRLRLLKPGWLVMHALIVVVCLVMVRLGIWQWGRGHVTGSIRNYSYGLEWWAFVAFTVVGWVKFCLDETSGVAPMPVGPGPVGSGPVRSAGATPAPRVVPDDDDPELAAWNARLAELARRDAEADAR